MSRRRDTGKMQEKQATGVFLEMLIVVVILGLLAAIAMPHVSQLFGKGKAEAWEAELHNIQTATVAMLFDSGTGTLVPVGPTADMTLVHTTDSPPLVLADYLGGLDGGAVTLGCQYIFAADGTVRQLLP
ncbi:MAG: hypothetical protein A2Z05_04885 [Chloroflexi bacterium RBG_16_60_22]|nr:MAG: hypothetical protein A2Z05_04885 [Chloroflexi bacterium RBG_16_60_22]